VLHQASRVKPFSAGKRTRGAVERGRAGLHQLAGSPLLVLSRCFPHSPVLLSCFVHTVTELQWPVSRA